MTDKVIALNSGGFDSVVMLHEIVNLYKEDVISIFFDYGQVNLRKEKECAKKVCEKLGIEHIEIVLPEMDWSSSSLYDSKKAGGIEEQYLEYRNLIFLSYAMSIAESRKASKIYSAIIEIEDNIYTDTKRGFIDSFTEFAKIQGFEFKTPFGEVDKFTLGILARMYGIKREDFFTCNEPNKSAFKIEPCGVCSDCLEIEDIYNEIVDNNVPIKSWFANGLKTSEEFERVFKQDPVTEVRLLINNDCQFSCKHCFYGFKDMDKAIMSESEFKAVIDDSIKTFGENVNFHFSGKEPLFDKTIFTYARYIRDNYPLASCDVVTNGVNVTRYIDDIKESGLRAVFLSVESLGDVVIRDTSQVVIKTIETVLANGVPIDIFLDITSDNYLDMKDIIEELHTKYGINNFYAKPIMPIGGGKELGDVIVTVEQYDKVFEDLLTLSEYKDLNIEFTMRSPWTKEYLASDDYLLSGVIKSMVETTLNQIGNIQVFPEFYCSTYENQVTITPDGYVLGCATEVSSEEYIEHSIGNVRDHSLTYLVDKGRDETLKRIRDVEKDEGEYNLPSCYHCPYEVKCK